MNSIRNGFLLLILLLIVIFNACINKTLDLEKEIEETESKFAEMAGEKGIPAAFIHFADDNAVILRNNRIIRGKDSIC